jgi:peptide-methionine (S)-S-oxide reductase
VQAIPPAIDWQFARGDFLTPTLAAKLNAYAAELCPANIQNRISSKIDEISKKGWLILRKI